MKEALSCDGHAPMSRLLITVEFCHDHQHWLGVTQQEARTVEGSTIVMASGRHEFGPFDSSIEVGYWLAGQSRALKGMASTDTMRRLCE